MTERAAIYCRISKDSTEKGEGVDRQETDCRVLAARLGVEVTTVFVDNDISASTKSRRVRPQYDEMMRRARRREFGVVLAYSNSRLTRRPRELEDLIDLHAATGVLLKTVVSGDDDLSTADGRMVARIKANVDAAEAERTAERVARAKKQAAEQGRYRGGPRPYGFNKDGVTHHKKEADVIRHATKAILSGRSLAAVVREINDQGHRTSRGAEWSRHSLRDVLLRHRNAGLIASGSVRKGAVAVGEAAWEPIISKDELHALERLLLDPARRTNNGTTESKYLGSGIYLCGREGCDSVMRSFTVPRRTKKGEKVKHPAYRCEQGDHLSIMARPTDAFVLDVVAEAVRDPRLVEAMTAGDTDATQADREQRDRLLLRLANTEADYDNDVIDGRRYKAKTEKINAELIAIEQRLAEAAQQATVSPIFSAVDPGAAFLAAPLDVQRGVLRSVLRVEVLPFTGTPGAAWSSERLQITSAVAS